MREKQTDRQTDRDTHREIRKERGGGGKETDRHGQNETANNRDRQTERKRSRPATRYLPPNNPLSDRPDDGGATGRARREQANIGCPLKQMKPDHCGSVRHSSVCNQSWKIRYDCNDPAPTKISDTVTFIFCGRFVL